MKACILRSPAPIETNPLEFTDVPKPEPADGQVLVRVNACGVCRTDLHVIEGELAPRKSPITPGHQVVGTIEAAGERREALSDRDARGHRLAALHRRHLRILPGADRKISATIPALPATPWMAVTPSTRWRRKASSIRFRKALRDLEAAPLLCAGIIGFRCLRLANAERGGRLGLYGFGAAASRRHPSGAALGRRGLRLHAR